MPEPPADAASLTVLAGPMKGQRLVLDDAVDDILIGSDPDCRLCLDLPGVSPIHARLWLEPEGATLYDTHSAGGVYVNDDPVVEQAPLRDGDIVWLGEPAQPGSVMLRFRHPGAAAAAPPAAEPSPAPAGAAAFEEPDLAAEVEGTAPAESPAPPAEPDEWLIEDVREPSRGAPAAASLESVLEEGAPSADDFYVIEEPAAAPAPPEPAEAPPTDEELFDWGAAEEPAPAPPPAAVPPSEPDFGADQDLLFDWTGPEPSAIPPAPPPPPSRVIAAGQPEPRPPAPPAAPTPPVAADEDVFFVEDEEPPAPSPPQPALAAEPRSRPEPAARPEMPPPEEPPARPMAAQPPRLRPHPPAAEERTPTPAVTGGVHVPRARAAAEPSRPATPAGSRLGGKRVLIMAGGAVLALAVGAVIAMQLLGAPRVDSVQPTRVRTGDTIVIQGRNFSDDPAGMVVRFQDRIEGRVVSASPGRVEVEVPAIATTPGKATEVAVVLSVGGRDAKAFELSVFQAPRIHGIAPSVAVPGEEITLAGTDWSPGAIVRFGTLEAQILELTPTSIRARVPALDVAEGTRVPVVVAMAGDTSNEVPFHVGRLPLLISVEPRAVKAGDPLVLKGMGFAPHPSANDLRVGGTRAVVVKASDSELLALVPRTPGDGQNAVELRVPGSEHVAQGTVAIAPPADPVEFRFIVEHPAAAGIVDPENGHDHVVLSTGIGPAFLISAAEGVSAGERAAEAQRRFAGAAAALKASQTADLEVRGLDGLPSIGLIGKQEPLLTVTSEDAAAYDEEWARGKGRADIVTPARLAVWWGAVARDLVLLLVRGDRPRYAAALAPEGRALVTLHEAARRTGRFGVPLETVSAQPAAWRQSLRSLAFRVPAAVKGPVEATAGTPAAAASAAPVQALAVDGIWTGSETESGATRYITVEFSAGSGTFTYERALSVTIPLQSVRQTARNVHFEFRSGIHLRVYEGVWDGQRVRGRVLGEDGVEIGSFELERKR